MVRATTVSGPAWDKTRSALRDIASKNADDGTKLKEASPEPPPEKPTAQHVKVIKEEEPPKELPKPTPAKEEAPPEPPKVVKTEKPAPEAPATEDVAPEGKEKLGPWQLKTKYEKLAKTYEKENVDLKRRITEMGDVKNLQEKAERLEARNKELEESIRYHDYSKSKEYKTQYRQPFEEAWKAAVMDFSELTVTDAEGNTRVATHQDLYKLISLPLGEARKQANEMFGDAADDAMAHYRQVRALADKQNKALEEAKKTGSAKEQERMAQQQKVVEELGRTWVEHTASDEQKYSFLQAKEGDDEWNTRLQSAKKFVDDSFLSNGANPKLTPEERSEIMRNHASVRGRAIGFSMIRLENKRLKAELAERDKIISQYKSAEPGAADGKPAVSSPVNPANRMSSIMEEIRKRARKA